MDGCEEMNPEVWNQILLREKMEYENKKNAKKEKTNLDSVESTRLRLCK